MQTSRSGVRARNLVTRFAGLLLMTLLTVMAAGVTRADAQQPTAVPCTGGDVPTKAANSGGPQNVPSQPDLVVTGTCYVRPGAANKYYYNNVNILANGKLIFTETHADNTTPGDEQTDFWVASIIVEGDGTATAPNGGAMMAGTEAAPYGSAGNHTGTLTIHLFGADQSKGNPFPPPAGNGPGQGVLCKSAQTQNKTGPCGIPWDRWVDNGNTVFTDLPGGVKDYFYQYGPLMGDSLGTQFSASPYTPSTQGYFGYKVLAVSYGGSLQLFGYKGTPATGATPVNTSSANSWIRLGADLAAGKTQLTLASAPGDKWQKDDQIVVSTTDYLPAHYEQLTITSVSGTTVNFTPATRWAHKGTRYTLPAPSSQYTRLNLDSDLTTNGVEDRASVALLSRSIRIVSAGDKVTGVPANDGFPAASTGYFFGGQAIFRQGFKSVEIKGVEFAQMGEGGRMGRYPVHFHEARVTPANTFVADSSVNESMTRWYVIHSTQNVLLARNVGFLSIGHGYYLEDGTEINNQLYSNIGIMARAAVQNAQNPRNVPGILALATAGSSLQYNSDVVNPSVFWITNGWNDFTGNMAAGAGTCGACYWLTPSLDSDTPDVYPMPAKPTDPLPHQNWSNASGKPTYAGLTTRLNGIGGATPLKSFYKNYCSSAQNSFETVLATGACLHVSPPTVPASSGDIIAVKSISPAFVAPQTADMYYPRMVGNRTPIMCPNGDCTTAHTCNNQNPDNCAVTVLDHYTTSFNWAEQNVSAIWLRTNWYLLTDSVITDVQTAGLTFVSGGDYTRSSIPEGYWDLVGNTLFIGETQKTNAYAYDIGPFNADSLKLDPTVKCASFTDACVNVAQGVSLPLVDFGTGQRMFNIYDGPVYQDSNGFLDITTTRGCTVANGCIYLNVAGVRNNPAPGTTSYMPNAAIGWKQPNGFYYPPAFHSRNLLFSNVDIRHYVIAPLFNRGTYLTNLAAVQHDYASKTSATYFNSYTDVDRQTELNDDDGSLTGLINNTETPNPQDTISVNEDPFFNAPVATPECDSNLGVSPGNACSPPSKTMPTPSARTSPYDYVTTVIYPDCAVTDTTNSACGSYPNDVPPTYVYGPPQIGVGPPPKNEPVLTQYSTFQNQIGRGGQWSKDCTAPFCYGVKLYRQLLTGTMPDPNAKPTAIPATREWLEWTNAGCGSTPANCDWPYDRMAGEALWQRSVLTANEGTYYIDTTRTITTQQTDPYAGVPTDINVSTVECSERTRVGVIANCQPRSVSGFQGGQTYYVLLSYAKSTTTVTYQIYVGDNFDLSTVTGVAAFAGTIHLGVSKMLPSGWPAATTWLTPAPKLINGPDGKADILQVTVNLESFGSTNLLNPQNEAAGLCQPRAVCGWSGGNCTFKPVDSTDSRVAANPLVKDRLQNACGKWAVKDLDFPNARLMGFSFTLPAAPNFVASNQYERPTPMAFPGTPPQPAWATLLKNTGKSPDDAAGGACFYPKIPGTTSGCPVSDPANTGPLN